MQAKASVWQNHTLIYISYRGYKTEINNHLATEFCLRRNYMGRLKHSTSHKVSEQY